MARKLLWIDLEMSGLDEKKHVIVELAAIVTGMNLKPIDETHFIVFQHPEDLETMDPWCVKTHGASGLLEAIPAGTPLEKVEDAVMELIDRHWTRHERPVLAGNSVSQDRRFIDAYMPRLSKRLHYRIVDISSFKEIFKGRYGIDVKKKNAHRAIDDIKESIYELEEFLKHIDLKMVSQEDDD